MTRQQNISWTVPSVDLVCSPLGYRVELGETEAMSPVIATHSTFEGTGEFEYLVGDSWVAFPETGLIGATASTRIRMLRQGETPTSVLVIGSDSFVLKMSLDCRDITAYRQVCETNSFMVDSVNCTSDGRIWVKDTSGTVTVMDGSLHPVNTFNIGSDVLSVVVDPVRDVMWMVYPSRVVAVRTADMSTFVDVATDSAVAVLGSDVSTASGSLFVAADALPNSFAMAVTLDGDVTRFAEYATGVCQWGARGAVACCGTSIVSFDGTTPTTRTAASIGLTTTLRAASTGKDRLLVTDGSTMVSNVNDSWGVRWRLRPPLYWSHVDIKATAGPAERGRVLYLTSPFGVAAYRDMMSTSWPYGSTEMPFSTAANWVGNVISTVVPELRSSHVWARITAISSDNVEPLVSSSSESSRSSASSVSSVSSSSRSSVSSLSSSSQSSLSSQSSNSSLSSASSQSSDSSSTYIADMVVTGDGSPSPNGVYAYAGVFGGYPMWNKDGGYSNGGWTIAYVGYNSDHLYRVFCQGCGPGGNAAYFCHTTPYYPPTGGSYWACQGATGTAYVNLAP